MSGDGRGFSRRRLLAVGAAGPALAACQPLVQAAGAPPLGFQGPRLSADALVAGDGARLPMQVWRAVDPQGREAEPWAVIVGLHGMDDYAAAFDLPGPYWAARGVATYAYDQRGFGRGPGRGVWGGQALMDDDLRVAAALVRQRHPGAVVAVVGESMGGAVAITACASATPPAVDRVVLASPAVWGWREQGAINSAALWVSAHLLPASRLTAPDWLARRIWASDNIPELRRMSLDRNMISATRIDAIYGLVDMMQAAEMQVGEIGAPTLYQYGAHDEIIPKHAAFHAAARLRPDQRSAYYRDGWHLLLRDLHRQAVLDDIVAFIRDPRAPLPSGAPAIPTRRRTPARAPETA